MLLLFVVVVVVVVKDIARLYGEVEASLSGNETPTSVKSIKEHRRK